MKSNISLHRQNMKISRDSQRVNYSIRTSQSSFGDRSYIIGPRCIAAINNN